MKQEEIEKYRAAGKIAAEAVRYAKSIIKKDMKLLEIAEKIEGKIIELGGKPAFPVNLSINEIAAHYTPVYNDETKASGLLKVDIGVNVEGYVADTAFSVDLENSEENKKLILASEEALKNALKTVKEGTESWKVGKEVQDTINKHGFTPIVNLCGHEIKQNQLHAGLSVPNHNNNSHKKFEKGVYAIEPFATNGEGKVYEGGTSGIYMFVQRRPIRDGLARELLNFIEEEYKTLPFCSRWIVKKFGTRALISLSLMEKIGILHHFPQLIEKSHKKVSQAETTVLITDKVEVLV